MDLSGLLILAKGLLEFRFIAYEANSLGGHQERNFEEWRRLIIIDRNLKLPYDSEATYPTLYLGKPCVKISINVAVHRRVQSLNDYNGFGIEVRAHHIA